MIPSKKLKTAVFTLVIASAATGSFSAHAETQKVTVTVPSARTIVRGAYATTRALLPVVGVYAYFSKIEPAILKHYKNEADQKTLKFLAKVFWGALTFEAVKEYGKTFGNTFSNVVDATITPAA